LAEEPLSVIDWLGQNPSDADRHLLLEPPVSTNALYPVIAVRPLDTKSVPVGLVPPGRTGLPAGLFQRSDVETLVSLIDQARVYRNPAMQSLLYTLLLSETLPPEDTDQAGQLVQARIDKLYDMGAVDAARAMADIAGGRTDQDLFRRWFDASLLTGDEDLSCAVLNQQPRLTDRYSDRIFCAARAGDWPLAELLRGSATSLDAIKAECVELLDRFLHPDFYEDADLPPPPARPTPLTFRAYEAIGERLPTAPLPAPFSHADLRDVAGWKAQLEAAERLARNGALSGNRFLGLYTERAPAASGGIWDRVRALQQFEIALDTGSTEAISKTLPPVWFAMEEAGTEVLFADLFADRLGLYPLPDPKAQDLAIRIGLLAAGYPTAADRLTGRDPETQFLTALASGTPNPNTAPDAQARAMADGFADPVTLPDDALQGLADARVGEVLLRALIQFDQGAAGNHEKLSNAIATLRAVGLEDTARLAALQLRLLGYR